MASDEGDEPGDHDVPFRSPLPPDDRLWRHPSELGGGEPRRAVWWRFRRSRAD